MFGCLLYGVRDIGRSPGVSTALDISTFERFEIGFAFRGVNAGWQKNRLDFDFAVFVEKALQEYVDDYMGEGVIYNNLPSYESVHDKYYAKRPEELMRIVEQKLWPAIQEINTFISLLKKVDFESELADIEERLSVFSQIERDEQYSIYLQLEETANELDNLRSESVIVDKKIRSYQVKIRNIIANIDEATHNSDNEKKLLIKICL